VIRTIAFLASVLAVLAHAEQANLVIQYGNPNGIWSAEFSPDGRFLVTIGAGLTSTASLWEVESGKQIGAWGSITSASFSADSRHVLVQVPSGVEARGIYSQEKQFYRNSPAAPIRRTENSSPPRRVKLSHCGKQSRATKSAPLSTTCCPGPCLTGLAMQHTTFGSG
jgi:hypothetical protein